MKFASHFAEVKRLLHAFGEVSSEPVTQADPGSREVDEALDQETKEPKLLLSDVIKANLTGSWRK